MNKSRLLLIFAAMALLLPSLSNGLANNAFFNIEDLRPGMKGIGKTCFQGDRPEEFQVEVLGVLRGISPGCNAVLARFSGGQIDKTGVFEGMSGSPVFIDGKLLGAVAFTFSFAKEAIGGITPIQEMVNAFETGDPLIPGGRASLKKSMLWRYRLDSSQDPIKSLIFHSDDSKPQQTISVLGGHALMPIATPLSLSGLDGRTVKAFAPQFKTMGMSLLQGAGRSAAPTSIKSTNGADNSPLEPGSNIVVSLVRGDLDLSAGGTVTYVDGSKVYAFGHNMFQLGFTELPMHKARAITVFPSLESSFKILEMGELAGAIRQDRGTGIYGVIGENPQMVPLVINLMNSRGGKKTFKYELARDALLTPILVNLAVYNTIIASERAQGYVTLTVKGKIDIRDEQPVEINSRFSSDSSAPNSASLSVAVPVNYIMAPGYKNLDLEKIELEISSQEIDQTAILDSIRSSRAEIRAGETLDLEVSYKKANGDLLQDTYPVKIPENITPGPLNLLVADGNALMSLDEEEEGDLLVPRDLSQLVRFINNIRKNDHLYIRIYRQESGLAVKGEGLPGLPPSILSILKSERKSGALAPINTSTFMEYELPFTDYMASGAKVLRVTVKPR
jgi:hypothetical protein